jgi:hypothetical protein
MLQALPTFWKVGFMNLCSAITLHGYEMIDMLVHFHIHN